MPTPPATLPSLIAGRLLAGAGPDELFAECEAAGFDLAAVIDILTEPYDHLPEGDAWEVEEVLEAGWAWDDPLFQLVEYAGLAAAAEVAARTSHWADVDVEAHHRGVAAWRRAGAAMDDRLDVREVYHLIADEEVPEAGRCGLLDSLARVYPLEELAMLAPVITRGHAELVGDVLRRRLSPLEAFEALRGEVESSELFAALNRYWLVELAANGSEEDAVLDTHARLLRQEFKPLASALRFARRQGERAWWMPILRRHGLKGSRAALDLLEDGLSPSEIAESLARAGYDDDEVLAALLENGIGSRPSLSMLRDSGWEIDRMVEALAHRSVLLPEVRRHLEDLGVGAAAQRVVLAKHWSEDLVDVVLDGQEPRPRLTRGPH